MAGRRMISFSFNGQSIGLSAHHVNTKTFSRCFDVQEGGLHLKVNIHGRLQNSWPREDGAILLPDGCEKAEIVPFDACLDRDRQGTSSSTSSGFSYQRSTSGSPFTFSSRLSQLSHSSSFSGSGKGQGKRPAPRLSFIRDKADKRKKGVSKIIQLSDIGPDGNLFEVFPIILHLSSVLKQYGDITVDIVKIAAEEQLAECGKLMPIIILDKKGHPIQDMLKTRGILSSF